MSVSTLLCLGVHRRKGTARKTGNDYDFCQARLCFELDTYENRASSLQGVGVQQREVEVPSGLYQRLIESVKSWPAMVEVDGEFGFGDRGATFRLRDIRPAPAKPVKAA